MIHHRTLRSAAALVSTLTVVACGSDSFSPGTSTNQLAGLSCTIPESQIFSGAPRNGIPALTDPEMAFPGSEGTETWQLDDRVVGFVVEDQPIAIPLNIFWWHEIVNLDLDGRSLAITHCPLTGSSIAFDRASLGGVEFGVSGLLYRNNLIMYDRTDGQESFWPQMALGATCGPSSGTSLETYPIVESTYDGWRKMYPNTLVATTNTGIARNYAAVAYPYGGYDVRTNTELLFPIPDAIDTRFAPKERVLGIPAGTGGWAYPYSELRKLGIRGVVEDHDGEAPFVVFWDAQAQGAMAHRPFVNGEALDFHIVDDLILDVQTGSRWHMDGVATHGPLAGTSLESLSDAFVAFWFAWPLFYPDIQAWRAQ